MNLIEACRSEEYRAALARIQAHSDRPVTRIDVVLCEDDRTYMLYGYNDADPDFCVTACFEPSAIGPGTLH